jgi:predicted small metal-binding protein
MAYSISCADMGANNCPASFTTESRDELIEHSGTHTKAAHPEMEVNGEFMTHLEATIKAV